MADPYLIPDSTVLANKLGLTQRSALAEAERDLVFTRATLRSQLDPTAFSPTFDLAHLCGIHRWLFSDLYDWAGEVRTHDYSKDGTHFWPVDSPSRLAAQSLNRSYLERILRPALGPAYDTAHAHRIAARDLAVLDEQTPG